MQKNLLKLAMIISFGSVIVGNSSAQGPYDWGQWRGPQRDGICKETGLLKTWPKEGPPLV